ncbi:MAG: penicillin-binding protein 2 [Patescibacteria group bacterium]
MKLTKHTNPFDHYPSLGPIHTSLDDYDPNTSVDGEYESDEPTETTRPLTPLVLLTVIIAGLLGLRLIDLQIVEGTKNRLLAEDNRVRNREIPPPRGEILDRQKRLLASNTATYSLEIYPAELPRNRADREAVFAAITNLTGLDVTVARTELESEGLTSLYPVTLASQIERDTALIWEMRVADLAGVSVQKIPARTYVDLPGLGQILGYVGRMSEEDKSRWPDHSLASFVGKAGLEVVYEDMLQGIPGKEHIEVDAKGRVERILAAELAIPGDSLVLTLDADLQRSLVTHLQEVAGEQQSTQAAAVAIDPKTGAVLAMASLPSFDPTVFLRADRSGERLALLASPDRPLINRVISGTYPSGSTLKPIIASAALAEGTISTATRLDTSAGVIEVGRWRFPDWKVHGVTDVKRALAESNDIFFYALGGGYGQIEGLGVNRLKMWLTKFGFGQKTGIDLPSEGVGLVPDDTWKRNRTGEGWYIGDSYHLAIGQGYFLTTPLQLVMATAAIANGGELLTPYLVAARQSAAGHQTEIHSKTVKLDHVADADLLAIVRDGLRQTVTEGTARSLQSVPTPVAGKTGTAQFGDDKQTHSWFTGFAPADDPQIVIAVLVEGGGESTEAAVPVANRFLTDWWQITHPED